jgi:hypothetical protein
MRQSLSGILGLSAGAAIAIVGGWYLAHAIADCFCNMPFFLDMSLRAALRFTGNGELDNPNDLETLALLWLLVTCVMLVAGVLACGHFAWRHWRSRHDRVETSRYVDARFKIPSRAVVSLLIGAALAVVLGWYLTFLLELVVVDLLSVDILSPVGRGVQFVLRQQGSADLADPAFTEGLALQFYWGLSALLVGAALSWRSFRRRSADARRRH